MKGKEAAFNTLGKKNYSSTIVHPYNPKAGVFEKVTNEIYKKYYLSQIKSSFLDFDKTNFGNVATEIYLEAHKAFKKNDKTELMRLFTHPNYELLKLCQKIKKEPPFTLWPYVDSAKIVNSSINAEQGDSIDINNFAQITVMMLCRDTENSQKLQYNVFERRLDIKKKNEWKIALIEDY